MNRETITNNSIKNIPPVGLDREYASIAPLILERINNALRSGRVILGKEVEEFEKRFADFVGGKYCVGVASGSDALLLSLMASGIGRGDEVITVASTFVATVSAIFRLGAQPVFVDIEPDTFAMNPSQLEKVITPKTKAIMPVHLYGHPAPMNEIMKVAARHQIPVFEDCAQAHGAEINGKRTGAFGKAGCFSFYATKNLGAYGDAGAVVTDDELFYTKLKQLRQHGAFTKYFYRDQIGINSRLDEVQAAILNVKLSYLEEWTRAREEAASYYSEKLNILNLSGMKLPVIKKGCRHVFYLYTVRLKERDALAAYLNERGIGASVNYPTPVHLQPAYQKLGFQIPKLPETERAAQEVLSFPLFPQITRAEQDVVLDAVQAFYKRKS